MPPATTAQIPSTFSTPEAAPVVGQAGRRPLVLGLVFVGLLGLLGRLLLVLTSYGSNDMQTWYGFASRIHAQGVGALYDHEVMFNHPPIMGHLAGAAYAFHDSTGVPFEWLFKLPMLFADLLAASLLYRSWRGRGEVRAALVFAVYCVNPISILISAYHGNTDSLCASLMLLAAVLMDGGRAFGAGLALAASINVKLVPVLLIAPIAACVSDRKALRAFMGGLSLGVLPFLPYLLGHFQAFCSNVLAYRSQSRVWGITFLAARLDDAEHIGPASGVIAHLWVKLGTPAVLLWPLGLAAWRRLRRPDLGARELAAFTMMGFTVLTPGWGIQYVVYPVALLFSVCLERAIWFSVVGGLYAFVMYAALWTGTFPMYSEFMAPQDPGRLMACLAWMLAARLLFELMRSEQRPPALTGGGVDTAPLSALRVVAERVRGRVGAALK